MASFNLEELLAEEVSSTFTPHCFHVEEDDTLTGYFRDASHYSQRLTDHLTVFWSDEEPKSIVGFRVKGFSGIISQLPNWMELNLPGHRLRLLFDKVRSDESQPSDGQVFDELSELAESASPQMA